MTDLAVRRLHRQIRSNPIDPVLAARHRAAQARIQGDDYWLGLIEERGTWESALPAEQDAALQRLRPLLPELEFEGAETFTCNRTRARLGVFSHPATGVRLHLIPGGSFTFKVRDPQTLVKVRRETVRVAPFLIAETPLTHAQFGEDASDLPLTSIDPDALDAWLETHPGLRLPHETEWEYACRAGTKTPYYWGETFDSSHCWHTSTTDAPRPPAEHRGFTNAFGLIDTLGNVWEACAHPDPEISPWGRIVRGGSVYSSNLGCRWTASSIATDLHAEDVGVRLAMSVPRVYATQHTFRVGDRFWHRQFGVGRVLEARRKRIHVQLDDRTTWLAHGLA